MFKRAILVDFENVCNEGLAYVDKLTEENKVAIFFSKNANHITFQTHQKLMESKADIEYLEVTVGGRNALDIQLATYLGVLVGRNAAEEYFIISKDNGFKHVENFLVQKLQVQVSCKPFIGKHFFEEKIEEEKVEKEEEKVKEEKVEEEKEESKIEEEKIEEKTEETKIEETKTEEGKRTEQKVEEKRIEEQKRVEQKIEVAEEPEKVVAAVTEDAATEERELRVEAVAQVETQEVLEKVEESVAEPKHVGVEPILKVGRNSKDEESGQKVLFLPRAVPEKKAEVFIFNGRGFVKEEAPQSKVEEKKEELREELREEPKEELREEQKEDIKKEAGKETKRKKRADRIKNKNEKKEKKQPEDVPVEPVVQEKIKKVAKLKEAESVEMVMAVEGGEEAAKQEAIKAEAEKKEAAKQVTKQEAVSTDNEKKEVTKPKNKRKKVEDSEKKPKNPKKEKTSEPFVLDEAAVERVILEAHETYKDKKLKTDVMMNFIKTGQRKALYNMLRGKLGQIDGQKVYNNLKQYMGETA